jgi:hypothetical protein
MAQPVVSVFSKVSNKIARLYRGGVSRLSTVSDAGHTSFRKHFLWLKILLLFGVLLTYLLIVARTRNAKCFTNTIILQNEQTFLWWRHHTHTHAHLQYTCTVSAWAAAWQPEWPWFECHRRGWDSLLHDGDVLLISFLYCSTWLVGLRLKWYILCPHSADCFERWNQKDVNVSGRG